MPDSTGRRDFLGVSLGALTSVTVGLGVHASAAPAGMATFTYKSVDGCDIKLDVHGASPSGRRPLAVWIHGGALIMGDRRGIDRRLLTRLLGAGYAVASIDYRLAPETKLAAILEDVKDAFRWLRREGPKSLGLETGRLAVLGGSAGGYLTLATGYLIEPRPTALVSFWGYGDLVGPWYSRPDPFYRRQPAVTEAEARASVGRVALSEPPPQSNRSRFYLYCRQNGLWPKEVAGHDPDRESKAFDPFCPIRNVSGRYPATLLIHGTADTDVPHEQSVLMDREFDRHRVPHEFLSLPGIGHGMAGVDATTVARVHDRVLAFLGQHLGPVS